MPEYRLTIKATNHLLESRNRSFVYHMLRTPGAWQKAWEEIDAARTRGLCLEAVVTNEDAQNLPYLQAALKESIRIFAPISSTHIESQDLP